MGAWSAVVVDAVGAASVSSWCCLISARWVVRAVRVSSAHATFTDTLRLSGREFGRRNERDAHYAEWRAGLELCDPCERRNRGSRRFRSG